MYEPTGDSRLTAALHFDMFRANVDAGFTEEQAMSIVHMFIYSAVIANRNEGGE